MPNLGDVVGVEVTDPFNPDADPQTVPGFVIKVEERPQGEDGPDVISVVTFNDDGSTVVRQVSEGAGLGSLSNADKGTAVDPTDYNAGRADTDTVGDGTNPGLGATNVGTAQPADPSGGDNPANGGEHRSV